MTLAGRGHWVSDVADRRRFVRYLASGLAGAASLVYFLIGTQAISVIDDTEEQTAFGITAGIAFLAGAILILLVDRRVLWILGAAVQAFIIYVYFDLAAERTPDFEFWGILIRVFQVLLLAALIYLAATTRKRAKPSSP